MSSQYTDSMSVATAWGPEWGKLHACGGERYVVGGPGSVMPGGVLGSCVHVVPLAISGFSERPPEIQLMQIWDQEFGLRLTDPCATSLRMFCAIEQPAKSSALVLEDLAARTALSNEQLGFILGASRRSIYNWRQGEPIGEDTEDRIFRVHAKILPISLRRTPAMSKIWLEAGDPSPLELLHEERWDEFDRHLASEMEPNSARIVQEVGLRQRRPEVYGHETRQLMLQAFVAGTRLAPRRAQWRPRELTGLDEFEQDDE